MRGTVSGRFSSTVRKKVKAPIFATYLTSLIAAQTTNRMLGRWSRVPSHLETLLRFTRCNFASPGELVAIPRG